MQNRFDQLLYDVRKNAALEVLGGNYTFLPTFSINKKPMKTIDELKSEIYELENVRAGVTTEIETLNAKNQNAQKRRGNIEARIAGLKWALNEPKKEE